MPEQTPNTCNGCAVQQGTHIPMDAILHPDDMAVDSLATAMKAKLARQRAKGYGGWDTPECTHQRLSDMLRSHVEKGDPVDVANFCAFLSARGEGIAAPAAQAVEPAAVHDEPPFLQRLRVEQQELDARQQKLSAFLSTPAFIALKADDANLLRKQESQQHALLQTLNQRIHSAAEQHLRSKNNG